MLSEQRQRHITQGCFCNTVPPEHLLRARRATKTSDQTPTKIKLFCQFWTPRWIKLCLTHLIVVFVHCPFPSQFKSQDIKTSRLNNDSKLSSNAKRLLDYDIISNSSITSATQDTDTFSLASTVTVSALRLYEGSTTTPQFS